MSTLTTRVNHNIYLFLQDCFAVIFEDYKITEAHHVTVFDTCFSGTKFGYGSVFLVVSSLKDEMIQNRDDHISFLNFFKCVSEIKSNIVELIRGNCSLNWSISKNLNTPSLGFTRHRFATCPERKRRLKRNP